MNHKLIVYRTEDLSPGLKGISCSFEHRPLSERSPEARSAYFRLRDDLHVNGLKQPLITYAGAILIGMRRFEILRDVLPEFPCVEVLEDVPNWGRQDIKRLNQFKRELYGADLERFIG